LKLVGSEKEYGSQRAVAYPNHSLIGWIDAWKSKNSPWSREKGWFDLGAKPRDLKAEEIAGE
jgi:hypothetical protein